MYIDDMKLFAKSENELEILIQAIRIYIQDIGMKFSRGKFTLIYIIIINKWKR